MKYLLKPVSKLPLVLSRPYASKIGFSKGPAPPKLNPEDQKEFERLVQQANTQMAIDDYNEQQGLSEKDNTATPKLATSDVGTFGSQMQTIPEFQGDVNPKTGEVNGPKQDPIRHGDWSFNGRVTDF